MTAIAVDLFSDTVTRPTPAMRRAMADAEVGDEQNREDPTVNRLQDMVAELLGNEAALFLPSGTMCNQVAFAVHCRPGDEILLHELAHPLLYEAGGPAALVGAIMRPLPGARGIYTAEQVRQAVRPRGALHAPHAGAFGGADGQHRGRRVLAAGPDRGGVRGGARGRTGLSHGRRPADERRGRERDTRPSLRRSRSTASGSTSRRDSARRWARVLAGSRAFIEEAWVFKQRFGGAMRQAGIIAAAGIHALEHHVDRLAEDHERARRLARGLAELRGSRSTPTGWRPTS